MLLQCTEIFSPGEDALSQPSSRVYEALGVLAENRARFEDLEEQQAHLEHPPLQVDPAATGRF